MQGLSVKVKDLKEGMRVVEYGYGCQIISTVLEDARLVASERDLAAVERKQDGR